MPRKVSESERAVMRGLKAEGLTTGQIARVTGRSKPAVLRAVGSAFAPIRPYSAERIAEIRRLYFDEELPIRTIARRLHADPDHLRAVVAPDALDREKQRRADAQTLFRQGLKLCQIAGRTGLSVYRVKKYTAGLERPSKPAPGASHDRAA